MPILSIRLSILNMKRMYNGQHITRACNETKIRSYMRFHRKRWGYSSYGIGYGCVDTVLRTVRNDGAPLNTDSV